MGNNISTRLRSTQRKADHGVWKAACLLAYRALCECGVNSSVWFWAWLMSKVPPSAHTHSGFAMLLEQRAGHAGGIVLALLSAALDLCRPPPVPVTRLFGGLVSHGSCVGGPFVARHPGGTFPQGISVVGRLVVGVFM